MATIELHILYYARHARLVKYNSMTTMHTNTIHRITTVFNLRENCNKFRPDNCDILTEIWTLTSYIVTYITL